MVQVLGQAGITLSATVAVDSSCSLTAMVWAPSDLIGLVTTIVRLSTLLAGDLGQGVGEVGRGDGAEQAAVGAGADLDVDRGGLELGLDLVGVVVVADRAAGASRLDRVDLLLAATGPADRDVARDEVVAAVAVLDLDDVAGRTEAVDLLGEDELHVVDSSQRPVEV